MLSGPTVAPLGSGCSPAEIVAPVTEECDARTVARTSRTGVTGPSQDFGESTKTGICRDVLVW